MVKQITKGDYMLGNAPVAAILPTTDLKRAKEFYTDKLGLKLKDLPMDDPLIFLAGEGTALVIYHRDQPTKAEHTVAGFNVKDVEQSVKDLESKGVTFEDYDLPGLKTVNHIMDYGQGKSAWFKDPDGNIIAINQM